MDQSGPKSLLDPSLVDRGIRVQCLTDLSHPSGGHNGSLTRQVRGAIPYDLGLAGEFYREGFFSRVGKWFSKELQVGDPAFDDAVYIRTTDPDALAGALSDEALRTAIREAVETLEMPVTLDRHTVTVEDTRISPGQVLPALRLVGRILERLERLAVARGLPRRPELATYPFLDPILEYLNEVTANSLDNRFWPKGLFLTGSTLDSLAGLAKVHTMVAETKRPNRILRLEQCHLIDGDLSPLGELRRLRVLELTDVPAARTLPPLDALTDLEELTICRCSVVDLAPLARLPKLAELWLQGTPVADLTPIQGLATLKKLDLRGTRVTDLRPVMALPQLEKLWIAGLNIHPDQVREVRAALPRLEFDPY